VETSAGLLANPSLTSHSCSLVILGYDCACLLLRCLAKFCQKDNQRWNSRPAARESSSNRRKPTIACSLHVESHGLPTAVHAKPLGMVQSCILPLSHKRGYNLPQNLLRSSSFPHSKEISRHVRRRKVFTSPQYFKGQPI
jgi:hypothetical protein